MEVHGGHWLIVRGLVQLEPLTSQYPDIFLLSYVVQRLLLFITCFLATFIIVSLKVSLTHEAEPFLRSRQLCNYWRTSQNFMEPEGSLPCS
jgi:hypothetical protein